MKVQKRHIKRWTIIWCNKFLLELFLILFPISLEQDLELSINWSIIISLAITIIILIIENYVSVHPRWNKYLWKLWYSSILITWNLWCFYKIYWLSKWLEKLKTLGLKSFWWIICLLLYYLLLWLYIIHSS